MGEVIIRYGYEDDVKAMKDLDRKLYPDDWHVVSGFGLKLLSRNRYVYKVVEIFNEGESTGKGEIKGYCSLIPLEKEAYDKLLCGEVKESDLCELAIKYEKGIEVYIYLSSMAVDIWSKDRKVYSSLLIRDLLDWIDDIERMGVVIKEIGLIAISDDGNRVFSKIGFKKVSEIVDEDGKIYNVYKGTTESLREEIKICVTTKSQ